MKLTLDGIKEKQSFEKAGIRLSGYNVKEVTENAKEAPV